VATALVRVALGNRLLAEDLGRTLSAEVLRHVVVRRDDLAALVEIPHGLGGRLAGRPRGDDAPGAVLAAERVPGDLLGVDAVLSQPTVHDLGQRGTGVGGLQAGAARVLGQHGPLLQHRARVAQDAVDGDAGHPGDVLGGLAGTDPGLDVAGGQGGHDLGVRHRDSGADRVWRAVGLQRPADPVVDGERQEPADLIGEHQGLTVLGEGYEAYRPHALPPSRARCCLACAPESQPPGRAGEHGTRPGHPMGVCHAVEVIDLQR
jgi:hypothetical protein